MNTTRRFLTSASVLRNIAPVTPEGGGGGTPPPVQLSVGAELRARGAKVVAVDPVAPAPVVAPAAPEPEPVIEGEPGEQITGGGAPEGETPEQELERLKAENATLAAGGEPDPVKAELERLRAENAALKAGKVAEPPAELPAPATLRFKSEAELAKAEEAAYAALEWAEDNADGFDGKDAAGNPVTYTAEQVKAWKRQAARDLRELPGHRAALAAHRAEEARARIAYKTHFDPKHPDFAAVRAVWAEYPGLAGNHKGAAEILAARRGLKPAAPGAPKAPVRAPVPPGRSPAAPVASNAPEVPVFDKDRAAREGTGFGHLLRRGL